MKSNNLSTDGQKTPPGKIVSVTYKLKKSAFVSFLDNGFSIGYVNIDLQKDQESDPNSFATTGGKSYPCLMEADGLQVTAYAEGKAGDFWTLELEIDGKSAAANPVKVETDHQGHLDFDQIIN